MLRTVLELQRVRARAQAEERVELPRPEASRVPRAAHDLAIVLPDAARNVVCDADVRFARVLQRLQQVHKGCCHGRRETHGALPKPGIYSAY